MTSLLSVYAQENIEWSFGAKDDYVFVKAEIASGWYIYSTELDENIGPVPTEVVFEPGDNYELLGFIEGTQPKEKKDKAFGVVIPIHEEQVVFKQKIKLNKPNVRVKGNVLYMMCNAEGCLPPEYFTFNVEIKE